MLPRVWGRECAVFHGAGWNGFHIACIGIEVDEFLLVTNWHPVTILWP